MRDDQDLCGQFIVKFMMRKVNGPACTGSAETQEGKIEAEPAGRHQALINSTNNTFAFMLHLYLFYFFVTSKWNTKIRWYIVAKY